MHTGNQTRKRYTAGLMVVLALLLCAPAPVRAAGTVPLPPVKPLALDGLHVMADGAPVQAPTPAKKPDFSRPSILQLLSFGQPPPVPRAKPMPAADAPISPADAALYKKIFAYQATARWDKADELVTQLKDMRLMGHVLFQRYTHPTAYKADYDELDGWLALYADQPGAERIYKLASIRRPSSADGALRKPVKAGGISGYLGMVMDNDKDYISPRKRSPLEKLSIAKLDRALRNDLTKGDPDRALRRLKSDKAAQILDPIEYDRQRAQIAARYMYTGKLDKALNLAAASARRSGNKVPTAGWIGGLSAWRQGNYRLSASLFELTATSPYVSGWTSAAGAYWASRAHMRSGHIREVNAWLQRAAAHPRTFYGLIATRSLGWDFDFNWAMPEMTSTLEKKLAAIPAGRRAMLLVSAGQYHLAEDELRKIDPGTDQTLMKALLAYANKAGLPSFSMRLAEAMPHPQGGLYDAALYPLSPWRPQGGYKVDRALIHAIIRQESRFDVAAESHSGATGLMQLMPATASFISGHRGYKSGTARSSLKDPQINLDIGQRYVKNLLDDDQISTELFSLVIAYNAGPGNLRKWKESLYDTADDPLLFIESLPVAETRAFAERVMANYWIYRLRLKQPAPSLDAVTEGRWARYAQLDAATATAG